MRIRNAVFVTLVVGACDMRENESVEVSATQISLQYRAYINNSIPSNVVLFSTPLGAYTDALARLDQMCSSSSKPRHECLGTSEIKIRPVLQQDATDTLEQYGYVATIARAIEGVNAVRTMFTTYENARAADFRATSSVLSTVLAYYIDVAKMALYDRDELVAKARELPEKLTQKGEELYGSEYGRLIRKRQLIRESQAIIERYRSAIVGQQAEYEALAAAYKTFHSAEPTTTLHDIAVSASNAALGDFAALQQQLVALVNTENGTPQDLTTRAARLEGFFDSQQHQFNIEIEKYRTFLAEEGAVVPDLTSRPLEILEGMQRYLLDRQQRMNAAAKTLFDGIKRRKSALVLLERDAQTRQTIADSTRAQAAADFLSQVTAQIQSTWAAAPIVAGIELVGTRYQAVLALLQAGAMCNDADVADWMHDGCGSYAINISKANLYLQSTLPRKLRRDATQLRTAGAPSAEVDALVAAVDANDLAKAVMLHDNLAHHMEVAP